MDERQQEVYQLSERHRHIIETLRLRVKELEGENKALQWQTKQLQDVIASQQQTIQDFQKIMQRQQVHIDQATTLSAQEETRNMKTSPLTPPEPQSWTAFQGRPEQAQFPRTPVVDNDVEPDNRVMRLKEGSEIESSKKHAAGGSRGSNRASAGKASSKILNGFEKDVTGVRGAQPIGPGGRYWQTVNSTATQDHGTPSEVAPKDVDEQGQQTVADANADDLDSRHRRIVSDPPPLESWHLNQV